MKATLPILFLLLALSTVVKAQEPALPAHDIDALFDSPDPRLRANKMVVYGIYRELLEAGHWELADKYLTDRYLQHNPSISSGRDAVQKFFTQVIKLAPRPVESKLKTPIIAVVAEGDLVTVLSVAERKDKAGKAYTTTWFDTWRIQDGKADEHWDCATKD